MAKQILIIEDDDFFMELLSKKVTSGGFEVIEAKNRQEGIEKLKTLKPDLVLLDLLLPNDDGLDVAGFKVLSKIKEDPATASIPVIILSNLSQKEDIEKGLKLGATDFMIKAQFTLEEILEKIKNILK